MYFFYSLPLIYVCCRLGVQRLLYFSTVYHILTHNYQRTFWVKLIQLLCFMCAAFWEVEPYLGGYLWSVLCAKLGTWSPHKADFCTCIFTCPKGSPAPQSCSLITWLAPILSVSESGFAHLTVGENLRTAWFPKLGVKGSLCSVETICGWRSEMKNLKSVASTDLATEDASDSRYQKILHLVLEWSSVSLCNFTSKVLPPSGFFRLMCDDAFTLPKMPKMFHLFPIKTRLENNITYYWATVFQSPANFLFSLS